MATSTVTLQAEFDRTSLTFTVPEELRNDILYCQKTLQEYINMHQVLSSKYDIDDWRVKDIEKEIQDIGNEQKSTIDSLRVIIENYFLELEQLNVPIDRQGTNKHIARQLSVTSYDSIEPDNVQKRLTENELFDKYIFVKFELPMPQDDVKTEQMEVEISPQDINLMAIPAKPLPQQAIKSQVSLLKPKSERVSVTAEVSPLTQVTKPNVYQTYNNKNMYTTTAATTGTTTALKTSSATTEAINNSRLNLLQALKKAKNQQKLAADAAANTKAANVSNPNKPTNSPVSIKNATNSVVSVSPTKSHSTVNIPIQSSTTSATSQSIPKVEKLKTPSPIKSELNPLINSSNSSSYDSLDLPEEDAEPIILGKEAFLRVVGLCTQTYKEFLMSRRSERKRRNVTSTEKIDFHYGTLVDIFDKFTNKNNKRPMLLSPPSTRSSKRIKEIDEKHNKATVRDSLSSSSSPNDDDKACHICHRNNGEQKIECLLCNKYFHKGCNKGAYKLREKYCSDCSRQKFNAKYSSSGESQEINALRAEHKKLYQRQLVLCSKSRSVTNQFAKKVKTKDQLELKNRRMKATIERLEQAIQTLRT